MKFRFLFLIFLSIHVSFAQIDTNQIDSTLFNNTIEFVVTGTKTFKKKTESAIIVHVIDAKSLDQLEACSLSDGLKFQPGLRVETNCQTCNYTQLRMNGLQGGYSQILINGRPIISPLIGLYGLEQIPVNMIDKIEIIRGGGSSLYGTSAIGGTVNVLTKLATKNNIEINSSTLLIGKKTLDNQLKLNTSIVNKNKNAGVTLFANKRIRGYFDANDDNFSEIAQLENLSIGMNSFLKINKNQKIELAINKLNEYRIGGDMNENPVNLRMQAEERNYNIWMGNIDYQININQRTNFILYSAIQLTKRKHFTGIFPDSIDLIQQYLQAPPYGSSDAKTLQNGFQLNHQLKSFFKKRNVITFGSEYILDEIVDEIPSYNYYVNQLTKNFGTFLQSDLDLSKKFNLLSGLRIDKHNYLNKIILSPRIALLYKYNNSSQFRFNYGAGFRAPQAFDSDLHIAFANGGVSRIQLSPNLTNENSTSFSTSYNFDQIKKNTIYGVTIDCFYTFLAHSFILENIGVDSIGEIFEKRNGSGALVKGVAIEGRINIAKKIQIETGFTLQQSKFNDEVTNIEGLPPSKFFMRTPNNYGYITLNLSPNKYWNFNLNNVYTGTMKVPHFGNELNNTSDRIVTTKTFNDLNIKIAYTKHLEKQLFDFEVYGGIKNCFNQYQTDFDTGKNRDSNFIYGPTLPRSFFIGLKLKSNS
jgi:outer membrane receptor for ferrienterochelin and colicins